jgi:hypothetical protein
MAVRRATLGILAIAAVAWAGGCGGEPRAAVRDAAAPVAARPPPRAAGHAGLDPIADRIQAALASKTPPDLAAVAADASRISGGADALYGDEPAWLADEDRVRYEGMVAQLRDRAAALQSAAEAGDVSRARERCYEVNASCVKCHGQFKKR